MKKLKIVCLLLSVLMLISGVACTEKGDTSTGNKDAESPYTNANSEFLNSMKGMSVTIGYPDVWRTPGENPIDDEWAMLIQSVAKDLGITINEKYYTNKENGGAFITESLSGNNSGNILAVSDTYVLKGVQNNAWAKLDQAIKDAGVDTSANYYCKPLIQSSNVDGGQYGVMFNAANGANFTALFYNVNMVTIDNKLEDPLDLYNKHQWNFSKFEDYCKKLTKTDATGKISVYGCQLPSPANMADFITMNGGAVGKLDSSGKWTQSLAETKTINALNYVYKWCYSDKCLYIPNGTWGTSFQNLYDGITAMAIGSYYCAANSYLKLKDEGGLGVVPLPLGPDGEKNDVFKVNGGSVYVVPTAYQKNADKYVYILDQIGRKWYETFEEVYKKQYSSIFYQDKYYDMFYKYMHGDILSDYNQSSLSLVSDASGYSTNLLVQTIAGGSSPSTVVDKFASAMQNAHSDQQGSNRWTGFN